MKRVRLFLLFTLMGLFVLVALVGCSEDGDISSIGLKDYAPDQVIEVPVGEWDYDAYTLVVTYDSGKKEELALTEDMIAETDLFKFYQEGEHEITVSYSNKKQVFKVAVKRATFGKLTFPDNNVFTYDGTAHTVEVEGDIPANAVVIYTGGNSFTNAGTYDVTAIVSCEGYVTARLATTVKIERAKYDMSDIKFEAKEFVYDGQLHSVAISGTLPEGVSLPTYTINEKQTAGVTDVGEYKVRAIFANNNPNYETIPDLETTLTITPAEYTVKGIDLVFKKEDGKVIDGLSKVYDGLNVTFDLNDYTKLSSKVSVSFSVCDKDGNVISTSNKNTGIKDAGVYTVKAEFTLADSKNYKPIEPIVCHFEVLKAEYPAIEMLQLLSNQVQYDGKEHSITIEENLPENVTVSYEYYLGETLVVDVDGKPVQSVIDAERYTVKAVFTHTDENYKVIEAIYATLQITPATLDTSKLGLGYRVELVYDGTPKSIVITQPLPEGVEVRYEYYLNGTLVTNFDGSLATAVVATGEYTVNIIFSVTNKNYAPVESMSISLLITEKK